jgi:hypothetical protein
VNAVMNLRVLAPRSYLFSWVASSFMSLTALWNDYDGVINFVEVKNDCSREKKEKCIYEGFFYTRTLFKLNSCWN